VEGNGTNGTGSHAAWLAEGAALARELRTQEDEVLGVLAIDPVRAGDALVALFEATADRIANPLPTAEALPPEEAARHREEEAAAATRFWERCNELAAMISSRT